MNFERLKIMHFHLEVKTCPFHNFIHMISAYVKTAIHPYLNQLKMPLPGCMDLADSQSQSSRPPMPPRIPRAGLSGDLGM